LHSQQCMSTILRQCITSTAILGLITCTACSAMQAQDNSSDSPTPVETVTSSQIVALGRLIPEGDVIKISVVNAQDSRVNQILVKEGDFVRENQVIALLQGQNKAEQQLREAEANVAIK
ncbi:HlyD family secretion protein, partial [Nostoc sp. NIES-2111]